MELTLDMDHMNFVWNSRKVYEFQTEGFVRISS